MSRATSTSACDSTVWTASTHPDRSCEPREQSTRAGTKSAQQTVQPVQRVDSYNTSDYSYDTFPTFSTDSSFVLDQPTPVDSTEHTPDFSDLLWHEETGFFNPTQDTTEINALLDLSNSSSAQANGLAVQHSLPSPQSTNISTPEASSGHSKNPSLQSTLFTSPASVARMAASGHRPELSMDLDPIHAADSQHASAHQYYPVSQFTSPTIQISKHSRGDSPARSDHERTKMTKKRSASNLSQSEYFPPQTSEHLMPPNHDLSQEWEDEEEQRAGLAPTQRGSETIQSFEDIEKQQLEDKTVSEVQHWLEATSLEPGAERKARSQYVRSDRLRSRSTGAHPNASQEPILMSNHHPGPGLEVDESSDYYYSTDSDDQASLTHDEHPPTKEAIKPVIQDIDIAPDALEPLPSQFIYSRPWRDPPASQRDDSIRYQPDSSAAAIEKFRLRAREFDSASRAATWGTGRRRLSDSDVNSIYLENKTRHQSLTKTKIRERGSSIMHEVKATVREQVLKRTNSRSRQYRPQPQHDVETVQSPEPIDEGSSTDSLPLSQTTSLSKQKPSSIGAALMGATNNLAAVGGGTTALNLDTDHHEGFFRKAIRRVRSKSDVNKSPKSPTGVTSMMTSLGGPPVPSLRSPAYDESSNVPHEATPVRQQNRAPPTRSPVRMSLSPRPANVMPNLDGFRLQVKELNPGLEPYLIERIAHDQVRRYKRLVSKKVEHAASVTDQKCASGTLCPAAGGQAEILPARPNTKDTVSNLAHFKIVPGGDSDNEESAFDGFVTPAAFPDGIPLPPAKKLPARFECPLCFQVKTFQKPSDWTKHVHEDVQPFTCTFPNCPEPKSFKRKADWVRHENERHRHLEWWSCNLSECNHQCFRKDNFVQHLVREHKRKEPKVKGRGTSTAKGKNKITTFSSEEQAFWDLVDACRHESPLEARNEPCKFCSNTCASWKKLSVHVGKHMEQIAMPVLELVEKRNVTKDTIISPIEPLQRPMQNYGNERGITVEMYTNTLSPMTQSAASNYQNSSAGHSPAMHQTYPGLLLHNGQYVTAYGNAGFGHEPFVPAYSMASHINNIAYETHDAYHMAVPRNQLATPYTSASHFSSSEINPSTTVDASYMSNNVQDSFDNDSQAYSSPEQRFGLYDSQTMHMDQIIGPNVVIQDEHTQTPVGGPQHTGNQQFVYAQQQQQHHDLPWHN